VEPAAGEGGVRRGDAEQRAPDPGAEAARAYPTRGRGQRDPTVFGRLHPMPSLSEVRWTLPGEPRRSEEILHLCSPARPANLCQVTKTLPHPLTPDLEGGDLAVRWQVLEGLAGHRGGCGYVHPAEQPAGEVGMGRGDVGAYPHPGGEGRAEGKRGAVRAGVFK